MGPSQTFFESKVTRPGPDHFLEKSYGPDWSGFSLNQSTKTLDWALSQNILPGSCWTKIYGLNQYNFLVDIGQDQTIKKKNWFIQARLTYDNRQIVHGLGQTLF